jgi:AcrR family transcriptional regulator/DNA-binding MarR family transcriptional regulator
MATTAERWAGRLKSLDVPATQVGEIQRSRLLAAAAAVIDEVGYEQSSVTRITDRARMSRRTFYELFSNREDCLVALLDEAAGRVERELQAAGLGGLGWCERVRGGLWVILSFLDAEPVLARVCVVQALRGGPRVLERRERLLGRLVGVLDEGRCESARGQQCSLVTAEGLVGGAFGVVYTRQREGDRGPLVGLLGELMGMIALQYLGGRAASREQRRSTPAPWEVSRSEQGSVVAEKDPLDEVKMRLTYRTARVLECIAQRPLASNRMVALSAGIADPGQISKLLRRLERLDLVVNRSGGHRSGEANAWELTALGSEVAERLAVLAGEGVRAA